MVKKANRGNNMKVGIVGSRNLMIYDLENYLPKECEKIISGGAVGIDRCAAEYAIRHGIDLEEFLPDYKKYGRAAPIVRNKIIVDASDMVIAFWDGSSKGTKMVIEYCEKTDKKCVVVKVV